MRWSVDTAIRDVRALAEMQLVWLEEPVIPDDIMSHARIVREGGVPNATGENLHTLHEFKQMIEAGGLATVTGWVGCGGVGRGHRRSDHADSDAAVARRGCDRVRSRPAARASWRRRIEKVQRR